ncbi:hypothetical protein [Pseudonocardia xishanensis]|uniref:Uncharacterized protein n=1 Tax=Pseudonocardia xishanensis TaxID=630995 RepID=A0ABP8S4S8_9PSEU
MRTDFGEAEEVEAIVDTVCRMIDSGRYERFAVEARRGTPVALRDQFDAAQGHVDSGLRRAAAMLSARGQLDSVSAAPRWVLRLVLRSTATWLLGAGSTCPHDPSPERPQPVVTAAWRPDLITCARCTHLLALVPGSAADRTCDSCSRVTSGLRDDGVFPGAFALGPVQLMLGVCRDCRWTT